jgi:hypothetical protein
MLLGKGNNINFWYDKWLNISMVEHFDIPEINHHLLQATVKDFIRNKNWYLPRFILLNYPNIPTIL